MTQLTRSATGLRPRSGRTFAGVFNVVPVGEVRCRPSDLTRLIGWSFLLFLVSLAADDRLPLGGWLADLVDSIPEVARPLLSNLYRWGTVGVVLVAVATAIGRRRWRFASALALVVGSTLAVGLWLADGLDPGGRQSIGDAPYPAVRLALAVGVVVVAEPHVPRTLRRLLLAVVWVASIGALAAGDAKVINTIASLLGGIAPVPGGMGVIEAGLIAGLTSAGIPDDAAVAAALTYRAFTAYLPPIWGWASLAWLRRRDLV